MKKLKNKKTLAAFSGKYLAACLLLGIGLFAFEITTTASTVLVGEEVKAGAAGKMENDTGTHQGGKHHRCACRGGKRHRCAHHNRSHHEESQIDEGIHEGQDGGEADQE